MKKKLFFLITTFFCNTLFSNIPLEIAIKNAIKMDVNYRNQIIDEKSSQIKKRNAQMKKLFSINSNISYIFKSEKMKIEFPGAIMYAGSKNNYDINLSLQQPIFSGNILSNLATLEEINLAIEKNKTLLKKIDIVFNVKSTYFKYILLLNKKKSLNYLIKNLNLHYRKIKNLYKEELVKKTDLLETERKIEELYINLEDLNSMITNESITFKKLCKMNINEIDKNYNENIRDYKSAFTEFKKSHPILKTIDEKIILLSYKGKIIKGEYLPQISGFAEIHYGKPGIDFFRNEWGSYFQAGVNVNLKIFNWNKQKRDLNIIKYSNQKIINEKEDFIFEGEKLLKQLYATKASIENKINILNKLIKISNEDTKLKKSLYEEQQISNIDYLESITKKERYISMKNEMKTHYELAELNINKVIGKYTEEL